LRSADDPEPIIDPFKRDEAAHQRRRVDLSHQLMATLRLWRRRRRVAWFAVGRPFPDWVFASVTGTALDESNVRKGFNRILDGAGRTSPRPASDVAHVRVTPGARTRADHVREPATCAPAMRPSRCACTRIGCRLRRRTLVNRLDDAASDVTQASPTTPDDEVQHRPDFYGSQRSACHPRRLLGTAVTLSTIIRDGTRNPLWVPGWIGKSEDSCRSRRKLAPGQPCAGKLRHPHRLIHIACAAGDADVERIGEHQLEVDPKHSPASSASRVRALLKPRSSGRLRGSDDR
jgi:hypothetical protein